MKGVPFFDEKTKEKAHRTASTAGFSGEVYPDPEDEPVITRPVGNNICNKNRSLF